MMADLNFSGASRSKLFDAAVAALEAELSTRRQQLQSRKGDCERLQEFEEFLTARSWQAHADVAVMPYTGVVLRLFVTVRTPQQHSELLQIFAVQGIEVARNESRDSGVDAGYDLTLSDRVRILLRISTAPQLVPSSSSPAVAKS